MPSLFAKQELAISYFGKSDMLSKTARPPQSPFTNPLLGTFWALLCCLPWAFGVFIGCQGESIDPASAGAGRNSPADIGADGSASEPDQGQGPEIIVVPDSINPDHVLREGVTGWISLVIDGDTVHLTVDGWYHRVRIQGIAAPECEMGLVSTSSGDQYVCESDDEYWGRSAYDALVGQFEGATVTVYCDQNVGEPCPQDMFDRYLAFLETEDEDVGEWVVRNGHAFSFTAYYSTRRATYCLAEDEAIANDRGMWALGDQDAVLAQMSGSTRDWYEDRDERCAEAIADDQ